MHRSERSWHNIEDYSRFFWFEGIVIKVERAQILICTLLSHYIRSRYILISGGMRLALITKLGCFGRSPLFYVTGGERGEKKSSILLFIIHSNQFTGT